MISLLTNIFRKRFDKKLLWLSSLCMTFALSFLLIKSFNFTFNTYSYIIYVIIGSLILHFSWKIRVWIIISVQSYWLLAMLAEIFITDNILLEWLLAKKYLLTIHYVFFYRSILPNIKEPYVLYFITSVSLIVFLWFESLQERSISWKFFIIGAVLIIGGWFFYLEGLEIYIAIYVIGMLIYRQYKQYNYDDLNKNDKSKYKRMQYSFLLYLVIVFTLSQYIIQIFPIKYINKKLNLLVPSITNLRSEYSGLKYYGYYSNEGGMYQNNKEQMGGSITEDDNTLLFLVKGDNPSSLLKGRIKDKYTGKKWINTHKTYFNNQKFAKNMTKDNLKSITIYPKNIKTVTLFSPHAFYKSEFSSENVFVNQDRIAYYSGPKNRKITTKYTVWYKKPKISVFNNKNDYLQLPETNLDYTKKLVKELTKGIESNQEKINILHDYLKNNEDFRYSLLVNQPDNYDDFVNYFLKEQKEGYCTYYASALVVMGRIADIPTRYVEGFKIPNFKNDDGFYEIRANRAHAWVEAYFEPYGWITLDPTPLYSSSNLDQLNNQLEPDEIDQKSEFVNNNENLEKNLEKENLIEEKTNVSNNFIILVFFTTALVLVIILYKKVKNKPSLEKNILKGIKETSKLADKLIKNDLTGDTFNEMMKKTVHILGMRYTKELGKLINRYLYTTQKLNFEELKQIEVFLDKYRKNSKKQIGFIKYLYFSIKNKYKRIYNKISEL